jgi:hypothetical protein
VAISANTTTEAQGFLVTVGTTRRVHYYDESRRICSSGACRLAFGSLFRRVGKLAFRHRAISWTGSEVLNIRKGESEERSPRVVAYGLGAEEIFIILVVVALVVYVLWRLLIRPRR